MPATINGTTGFGGNLSGNVTGNVTGNVAGNSDSATKLSTASGDAPSFSCRAWVNFDGTKDTTGATSTANTSRLIRASGNVTSVLRNAAGDYTITFTTPMLDANYCLNAAGQRGDGAAAVPMLVGVYASSANAYVPTASSVRVATASGGGTPLDAPAAFVSIFR